MNVLVGENDFGKAALINAIKYVLKTNAYKTIHAPHDDLYEESNYLRIESFIDEIQTKRLAIFTECTIPVYGKEYCQMRLIIYVEAKTIVFYYTMYWREAMGYDAVMRMSIRTNYLKSIRDVENELTAKKNSRLP